MAALILYLILAHSSELQNNEVEGIEDEGLGALVTMRISTPPISFKKLTRHMLLTLSSPFGVSSSYRLGCPPTPTDLVSTRLV